MFEQVIVGLDGSSSAEQSIPVAQRLCRGRLTLLRVVQDGVELADEEEVLRESARRHSAELAIVIAGDPAAAIGAELARDPKSTAVLATHGRNAWSEAILGSVALRVLREAQRPIVLFRPGAGKWEIREKVETVVTVVDGSQFSEKILAHAARAARELSARVLLLQSLEPHPAAAPLTPPPGSDLLESSYVHRKAAETEARHRVKTEWDVLHGEPGPAICRYVRGMAGVVLAMTTHARAPMERLLMGSVTGYCIRHSGVPLLLYWPAQQRG